MKTITIRLPEPMAADIEAESEERGISKSDVVRERLERTRGKAGKTHGIEDLIGSVRRLPADLSAKKKAYLRSTGYGRKHSR